MSASNARPTRGPVLITGASTGIGRACAITLARIGFRVLAGVRSARDAASISEASEQFDLKPVSLDVTDANSIVAAAAHVREITGTESLCGLINNAGISISGPVECVPLEGWRRQFEVNVFGAVAVTQAMLPLLREHAVAHGRGSARIVMISSIAGLISTPYAAPYAASKFALEAVSDALRMEIRPQGIRVSIVEPGAIDTPIWKKEHEREVPWSDTSRTLYGEGYAAFSAAAQRAAGGAVPPARVAEVVARCLTVRRPRTRYTVGTDAKFGSFFKPLLPDRLLDRGITRAMKLPR